MLNKIFNSKLIRVVLALTLIYFAFRKVDVTEIFFQLSKVPIWFVLLNVLYAFLVSILSSYRWSLLLFDSPKFKEAFVFTRATYAGLFYSLLLPSAVAGDLIKWVHIHNEYPDLKKVKLLSSVLVDRVIGFSAFILVAFVSSIIGKIIGINVPNYLLFLFFILFSGTVLFYLLVFFVDLEKYFSKVPFFDKLINIVDLLQNENKKKIIKCLIISFICEFAWFSPVWVASMMFNSGFSLLSVFIFMPIISLLLVLPISVAGFGGREYLFVFFFSQLGYLDAKILLVSTFIGLITVLNAFVGGIWLLFKR